MTYTAIYPGTFDPIHFGHLDIAARAARIFDRLIVAVYDRPAKSLMFTTEERMSLARRALADLPNVEVAAYSSLTVDFARQVGAQAIVRGLRVISDFEFEHLMAYTNYQLAPEIEFVCLMTRQTYAFLSSSILKEIALLGGDVSAMTPPHVAAALESKRREHEHNQQPAPVISLRD